MANTPKSRLRTSKREPFVDVVKGGAGRKFAARALKGKARRILHWLNLNNSELSLALVGDEEMRALNARYRQRHEATDVLSFAYGDSLPGGRLLIGDVVISVESAERQANRRRKPLATEMETLLIHGILHNLGYDHERSPQDARVMKAMERRIQKALCEESDAGV